jgi:hypothetical protein
MFGMLDYRARKLFILLFGVPVFILRWFFTLGVPLGSYVIAKNYADSLWEVILFGIPTLLGGYIVAIIIMFPIGVLWSFLLLL